MQVLKEVLPQSYEITIIEDDTKYIKEEKEKCWQQFKQEQSGLIAKTIPGFRSDHVPRSIGEKKFELGQIYRDLLNQILSKGLAQSGLSICALNSNKVEFGINDGPIIIVVEVNLTPEVTLGQYKDLVIKYDPIKVTDSEVEAVLQRLREANAIEQKVTDRSVKMGDVVQVEFVGIIDGKEFEGGSTKRKDGTHRRHQIIVGSGQFVKGFEEQLVGLEIDKTATIKIIFPENYHKKEFRLKEAIFEVTVKEISTKILPELNDDFAKLSGYLNLVDARDRLREDLIANKRHQNEMLIEDKIMMELVKNCKLSPIPKKIIQEQLDRELQRLLLRLNLTEKAYFEKTRSNRDGFDRQYKSMVERDIKIRYILEAIAVAENISVPDEEMQAFLKAEAEKRKVGMERLDTNILRKNITIQKVLTFVKEHSKIEALEAQEVSEKPKITEIVPEERNG